MSNAFAIEAMESRLLLSVDPALNGAEVDPAMRAAARSYGTETAQFLTKVQNWIYDTALGCGLALLTTWVIFPSRWRGQPNTGS